MWVFFGYYGSFGLFAGLVLPIGLVFPSGVSALFLVLVGVMWFRGRASSSGMFRFVNGAVAGFVRSSCVPAGLECVLSVGRVRPMRDLRLPIAVRTSCFWGSFDGCFFFAALPVDLLVSIGVF